MKLTLTSKLFKTVTFVVLFATVYLAASQAFATTYTFNSANGSWRAASHWSPVGVPTRNDDVIINNGSTVTVSAGEVIECKSLSIISNKTGNTTTTFNLAGQILHVYEGVLLEGGTGQSPKFAVLLLEGGTINMGTTMLRTGSTTVTYNTANNVKVGYINENMPISALPVELIAFNAAKKGAEVLLTWETASEKNNAGFEVQASTNGKTYEAVGFVASKNANTSSLQRYAYADKAGNKEGLVYYRLKQVDLDGTEAYYTAKVVDLGRFAATVTTFPNPFQNQFEINVVTAAAGTAQIEVTDMTGKVVYTTKSNVQHGVNALKVELNNVPAGLYLLKATTGNQTYTNRLVKQ